MFAGNPNAPRRPFAPQHPQMARPMRPGANPYGFGMERIAGKLALQRNRPGMPTNTFPMPPRRMPRFGGY